MFLVENECWGAAVVVQKGGMQEIQPAFDCPRRIYCVRCNFELIETEDACPRPTCGPTVVEWTVDDEQRLLRFLMLTEQVRDQSDPFYRQMEDGGFRYTYRFVFRFSPRLSLIEQPVDVPDSILSETTEEAIRVLEVLMGRPIVKRGDWLQPVWTGVNGTVSFYWTRPSDGVHTFDEHVSLARALSAPLEIRNFWGWRSPACTVPVLTPRARMHGPVPVSYTHLTLPTNREV